MTTFKKTASYEVTLNKNDIERILRSYFESELNSTDKDFKESRWMQDDYTYNFKDGQPSIDVVIIIDDCNLRK